MKAISLHQIWASLVAGNLKRYETRHWPMRFEEPFAVHAAKKWTRPMEAFAKTPVMLNALSELFCVRLTPKDDLRKLLPFGEAIAVCEWAKPKKIVASQIYPLFTRAESWAVLEDGTRITGREIHFGDYTSGRFAIELGPVKALKRPFPCCGRQGPFNVSDVLIKNALK